MYDAKKYINNVMNSVQSTWQRFGPAVVGLSLIVLCSGCAAPTHAASLPTVSETGDTPDAVFDLWEQHWTLNADGSTIYREKTHTRLNSDRTYRVFGDPRIAFNKATDTVEVLQARTRLPDGTYVELADYSTVEVAPDDTAGWPAFGNLTQMVLVMGGIEPGCVLELDHQITTKAGTHPYLAADLRIDNLYPIAARTVTVTVPSGTQLSPLVAGLPETAYAYNFEQHADGSVTHRWDFTGLEGQPDESQSLPWRERGVRLAFTTAPDAATWIGQRLATIDQAAGESPLISKLAGEWTEDAHTNAEKLASLQNKFADTFNFVEFNVAWRPATPRPATDVLNVCYGLPAESAAALLALARAAGVTIQPALLTKDEVWNDTTPQAALVADYVLKYDDPAGVEIWHPRHGRIRRDSQWAGYTVLTINAGKVQRLRMPAYTSADDSRCFVTGNLTLDDHGKYTGNLTIKTTGLFVSPGDLDTADGQKQHVRRIVDHLLPGAKVVDFTLKSLTTDAFEAEAEIESNDPLEKLHDCYMFELDQTSPALAEVRIPLTHSRRMTAARLTGPFDEMIDLTVTWPKQWNVEALPGSIAENSGKYGTIVQTTTPLDHGCRLLRHVRITLRDLTPEQVVTIRKPLNELSSPYARTLLLLP